MHHLRFAFLLLPILVASCSTPGHQVHFENATGAAVPKVHCRLLRVDGESSTSMVLPAGETGRFGAPVGIPVRSVDVEVTWDAAAPAQTFRVGVGVQHALDVRLRLLPGHKVEFVDAAAAAKAGLTLQVVGG